MPQLLWDASALAKRYYEEAGSEAVDALFVAAPSSAILVTYMGYAETAAILRRKLNGGLLNPLAFRQARLTLENEVLLGSQFGLLTMEDADVLMGISLTDRHNINSTDAAILSALLRYAQPQQPSSPACLFVAADRRLLRAAVAEGLQTLNPELVPAADIPALMARP